MKAVISGVILMVALNANSGSQGWYTVYTGTSGFFQRVCFVNENTGYAVKYTPNNIAKTTNGGLSWSLQTTGITQLNRAIFFINSLTGFVGADGERIIKTTDGGENWNLIYSGGGSSYMTDFSFCDEFTGYAVGGNGGTVLKTTNQGNNWSEVFSGGMDFFRVRFVNNTTGYAGGFYAIMKTTNGGYNWFPQQNSNTIYGLFFMNADTGFATGGWSNAGNVYKTTNGGLQWITVFSSPSCLTSITFVNNDTGYVAGWNNYIYRTTNKGINWISQQPASSAPWNDITFINQSTGYVVGGYYILKTISGGVTAVSSFSNNIPDKFFLSQNYPNPFNPDTKIKFEIPKSGLVNISVYDILGRKIESLVNENLNPGTYEVNWNASSYPSGVYYCKINAGDYSETRKMILLK